MKTQITAEMLIAGKAPANIQRQFEIKYRDALPDEGSPVDDREIRQIEAETFVEILRWQDRNNLPRDIEAGE